MDDNREVKFWRDGDVGGIGDSACCIEVGDLYIRVTSYGCSTRGDEV